MVQVAASQPPASPCALSAGAFVAAVTVIARRHDAYCRCSVPTSSRLQLVKAPPCMHLWAHRGSSPAGARGITSTALFFSCSANICGQSRPVSHVPGSGAVAAAALAAPVAPQRAPEGRQRSLRLRRRALHSPDNLIKSRHVDVPPIRGGAWLCTVRGAWRPPAIACFVMIPQPLRLHGSWLVPAPSVCEGTAARYADGCSPATRSCAI